MAERRMFSKTIIDSDAFLDMPLSSQTLYFHLSMRADDDGFINNPRKIQRMIGASDDDLKILVGKKFIIPFESGIVVIKHWKIHNYIRGDRKKSTTHIDEARLLDERENGTYTLKTVDLLEEKSPCQSDVSQMSVTCPPNGSIGKVRLGKVSIGKDSISTIVEQSPTTYPFREVIDYINQVTGKKFKHTTGKTKDLIKARVNEGFTVDDFKRVIDIKTAEWNVEPKKGQKDMRQYLRPETLFGTKFESYLNQTPRKGADSDTGTENKAVKSLTEIAIERGLGDGEFEGF